MEVKKERFEFKYLVPVAILDALRQAIAPFVEVDRHVRTESGDYAVHSLYWDTRALDFYREKMAGLKIRKKIRIRGYNQLQGNSPVFLEIKRKNNLAISKNRAWLLYRDLEPLFASGDLERYLGTGASDPRDLEDARRFFYYVYRYSLRPVILIHYEREAFFCKFDPSVRLTFDKNLRSTPFPLLRELFVEDGALPSLPRHCILEVKFFVGIPSWLKAILEDFALERTSVSKYTLCLDKHGVSQNSPKNAIWFFSNGHLTAAGSLEAISVRLASIEDSGDDRISSYPRPLEKVATAS